MKKLMLISILLLSGCMTEGPYPVTDNVLVEAQHVCKDNGNLAAIWVKYDGHDINRSYEYRFWFKCYNYATFEQLWIQTKDNKGFMVLVKESP